MQYERVSAALYFFVFYEKGNNHYPHLNLNQKTPDAK